MRLLRKELIARKLLLRSKIKLFPDKEPFIYKVTGGGEEFMRSPKNICLLGGSKVKNWKLMGG